MQYWDYSRNFAGFKNVLVLSKNSKLIAAVIVTFVDIGKKTQET